MVPEDQAGESPNKILNGATAAPMARWKCGLEGTEMPMKFDGDRHDNSGAC